MLEKQAIGQSGPKLRFALILCLLSHQGESKKKQNELWSSYNRRKNEINLTAKDSYRDLSEILITAKSKCYANLLLQIV